MLKAGDEALDFTITTDDGSSFTLSKARGSKILLFFYPKDNTPGCTQQACDLRDHYADLKAQGVKIYGISRDNQKSHQRFKQKYQLPFPLLIDADGNVSEAYGVLNKKSLFGKTFLGVTRSSFLIDEQGIILAVWRKVKVPQHVELILNELK